MELVLRFILYTTLASTDIEKVDKGGIWMILLLKS